ncbi:MAG TPA: hypothetical protein VK581_10450 [Chthoniobacterales bacterium]|nr:hypothetical protein [Chthoniobacterales bacterium]
MNKTTLLLLFALIVIIFSIVPVGELWLLRQAGFDIVAHLQAVSSKDGRVQFYFEAFGAAAFVIVQTVVLVWIFVWGAKTLGPMLLQNAINMFVNYLNKL